MAGNTLRMSGLNSGLDTESIVNALTAATKNKINKNQRTVLKLQAQQDAYRTIIDKLNAFKSKYLDILNVGSCLKSKSLFNSFKSTLTGKDGSSYIPGVTVSSNVNANAGSYDVKVKAVATQSAYKSSSSTGKAIELDDLDDGEQYTMKVTVGEKTKSVTFTAGANAAETRDNINEALKETFGTTNSGTGRVFLNSELKFESTDKSAVVFTKPSWYTTDRTVDFTQEGNAIKTGKNSFDITVNGETKTVTFSTVSEDYFDYIFDDWGNILSEDDIETLFDNITDEDELKETLKEYASKLNLNLNLDDPNLDIEKAEDSIKTELLDRLDLFKQVVENQRQGDIYDSYTEWWENLDESDRRDFAQEVGAKEYQEAKQKYDDDYNKTIRNLMALQEYEESDYSDEDSDDYMSFDDFLNDVFTDPSDTEIEDFIQENKKAAQLHEKYQANLQRLKDTYDKQTRNFIESETKLAYNKYFAEAKEQAYNDAVARGDFSDDPDDPDYKSIDDFKFTAADFEDEDGDYISYYNQYLNEKDNINSTYGQKYLDIADEYDYYFDLAKQDAYDAAKQAAYDKAEQAARDEYIKAAYEEAKENGEIDSKTTLAQFKKNFDADANGFVFDDSEFTFEDIEDFKYTDADFEKKGGDHYQDFLDAKAAIEEDPQYEGKYIVDINRMSDSQRLAYYDKYQPGNYNIESSEDYFNSFLTDHFGTDANDAPNAAREAAYLFNKANIENNLNSLYFSGGITGIKAEYTRDENGNCQLHIEAKKNIDGISYTPRFAITANEKSANTFGFDTTDVTGTASQVSTTSKLSELGLEPDANGNYNFTINGVRFSFSGDTTVNDMMKKVSATAEAKVKMTYDTIKNQFNITANEYGTDVDISLEDGGQGLLVALGFAYYDDDNNIIVDRDNFVEGHNTELEINGEYIETASNSYTVDGTTFTFTQAAVGQEFTNEVSRDYSKAIDVIKGFVEDYNKLIDDIYGYVDDEPNKDYYFLTDDDIDEMDLSESQQNKWEKLAQKGILYRDSTLTDIMSRLRTVLYNSVDAADGKKVGLYTLGITTSSDFTNHGKLIFDENKNFEELFEMYADEITELFTDPDKGIGYQFETVINNATRTTGEAGSRGTLVEKAGVAGTASATSNSIYNKIKNLKDMIANLQKRYEQQQDRYWKIYANMETMLGNLNSQTSYINQLMGNF